MVCNIKDLVSDVIKYLKPKETLPEVFARALLRSILLGKVREKSDWEKEKRKIAREMRIRRMPKDSEIIPLLEGKVPGDILYKLRRKPTRTISGVSPIAVMIKPEDSCKWNCTYCPLSPLAPRSYLGYEPSSLRARRNDFHPYKQVKDRLNHYKIQGHPADKCDVIVMGGTFLAMPKEYKFWFMRQIYFAFNDAYTDNLEVAKRFNESAKHRIVGLTIETRPDVAGQTHIEEMLHFGATRVELGVQHPDDNIYRLVKRGHTVKDVIDATRRLKNAGFKLVYHLMPGLPGSSPEKDVEMFRKIFSDSRFMPDMLKIYPTLVVPGSQLYDAYKEGEYVPYSAEEAAEVIAKAYAYIPYFVRVMRVQRDIPANLIEGGVKKSNLRELVHKKLNELGIKPKEIRSREVGFTHRNPEEAVLFVEEYFASGGKEFFLSFETEDRETIFALLRLRILPEDSPTEEMSKGDAVIRELHVYGPEAKISERSSEKIQHLGFGRKLVEKAEEIASTEGAESLFVISGPGVREYYRHLGFVLHKKYMAKLVN